MLYIYNFGKTNTLLSEPQKLILAPARPDRTMRTIQPASPRTGLRPAAGGLRAVTAEQTRNAATLKTLSIRRSGRFTNAAGATETVRWGARRGAGGGHR